MNPFNEILYMTARLHSVLIRITTRTLINPRLRISHHSHRPPAPKEREDIPPITRRGACNVGRGKFFPLAIEGIKTGLIA